MFLSDLEIKRLVEQRVLRIEPYSDEIVSSNGIDLRLGPEYAVLLHSKEVLDTRKGEIKPDLYFDRRVASEIIEVSPNTIYLFSTLEYLEMPRNLIGLLGLRSTYARLGFTMPLTVVDAGFCGTLTIQVRSGPFPIRLKVGERFFHMVVAKLSSEVEREYVGKYWGVRGLALPRL